MTAKIERDESDSGKPGSAREKQAQQAATDSVDTGRLLPGEGAVTDVLLPGEDPDGGHFDDIEHWIAVYSELLDFKRFMLDGAAARAARMTTPEAKEEIESTDLRVARAEAERFSRRLAFWRSLRDTYQAKAEAGLPPAT